VFLVHLNDPMTWALLYPEPAVELQVEQEAAVFEVHVKQEGWQLRQLPAEG
jgi:hypothetical protein